MLGAIVCVLALHQVAAIAVIPDLPSVQYGEYANSWAVEVSGGEEKANALAAKHGFVNSGTVGSLKDMYHFVLDSSRRREAGNPSEPNTYFTTALSNEPEVKFVEQQKVHNMVKKYYQPSILANPSWQYQWGVNNTGQTGEPSLRLDINVEPAWIQGYTGKGIVVGVVDDGVEFTHSDLRDNYEAQYSFNYADDVFSSNPSPARTSDSHGTNVAGEIVMTRNNTVCGVGVAYDARLAGLRLLGGNSVTDIKEAGALSHSRSSIHIYSNSWGPSDVGTRASRPATVTQMALEQGTTMGRNNRGNIFTFAAGNGGEFFDSCAADGYASNLYTIAVGSYSQNGAPASYDERCSSKMVVAYVSNTRNSALQVSTTTTNGGCNNEFDGTSSAAPYVSGVIALALEANPQLTWRDVQYLIVYTSNPNPLMSSTPDVATNGAGLRVSHQFGFGAIDAEAMVTRAQRWINVPEQRNETVYSSPPTRDVFSDRPVTRTFTYTGSIRSLESVVVTMTLGVAGVVGPRLSENEATNQVLEDEQNGVNIGNPNFYQSIVKRGDISATLTSPDGTVSTILFRRPWDITSAVGYDNWSFRTVLHWGENPTGQWSLQVSFSNSRITAVASVSGISVDFYGVTQVPLSVQQIPSQCDSACARGCSDTGPDNCDACASNLVRNATTLGCIEPQECNLVNNTIASGYCYTPSSAVHSAVVHTSILLVALLVAFIAK